MKQSYIWIFIIALVLNCGNWEQSPVMVAPEHNIIASVRTEMTVESLVWQDTPIVKISIDASSTGEAITLSCQCIDPFGFEIINEAQQVIFQYPPRCEPYQHDLVIKRYNRSVHRQATFGLDLPVGVYTVSGGLLEHGHKYPWVVRTLVVSE